MCMSVYIYIYILNIGVWRECNIRKVETMREGVIKKKHCAEFAKRMLACPFSISTSCYRLGVHGSSLGLMLPEGDLIPGATK